MKFKNHIDIAEMDTKIEIKQEPWLLKRTSTESEEALGLNAHIKSESAPFASVFIMETDSNIHVVDHEVDTDSNMHGVDHEVDTDSNMRVVDYEVDTITKIKEHSRGLERALTEQQSEFEDTLGSDVQVKSKLVSFVSPFIVEPDSDIQEDDHNKNIRSEIKKEPGFLEGATEMKPESEEIDIKDESLQFDTEDQLSEGDQKLLLPKPTRLAMWNYETGIVTADLDTNCLKLEENSNSCHDNTSAAHTDHSSVNTDKKSSIRCLR